jgi:hypothetical protein
MSSYSRPIALAVKDGPPSSDEWGMTAEDHEVEQDAMLRSLASRKAEREARDALISLAKCVRRNRLMTLAFIILIGSITLFCAWHGIQ